MDIQASLAPRSEDGRKGTMRQTEIECHECGQTIYADIDTGINGNHVILCPCGHEHCRVVERGRITSSRWDQRNRTASTVTASTTTTGTDFYIWSSVTMTSTASSYFTVVCA